MKKKGVGGWVEKLDPSTCESILCSLERDFSIVTMGSVMDFFSSSSLLLFSDDFRFIFFLFPPLDW